jgi:hypothetical protein
MILGWAIGIDAIPCDLPSGDNSRRRATADMCYSGHDTGHDAENVDATRAKLMRAILARDSVPSLTF